MTIRHLSGVGVWSCSGLQLQDLETRSAALSLSALTPELLGNDRESLELLLGSHVAAAGSSCLHGKAQTRCSDC